ncbi:MAG TPA: PT domain-containing protein [Candidatus Ruminococcus avistercoris]|nr:PT domain-containing protein [Candidatus Ruminococcus avistercoris]
MKRFDGNREHRSRRLWKTISFLLVMAMVFTTVTIQWPSPAQASGTSVYLNGSGGSDSADGSSEAAAVQSFGRAKELAGGSGEILVCGTVYTSGDTTWSLPGGVSLRRAPGFSGAIVNISGTLTLKNISLSSGDISGSGSIAGEDKTEPSEEPTKEPTKEPTAEPTAEPTKEPTAEPTKEPTAEPTKEPTAEPTKEPTAEPSEEPTKEPTKEPTAEPSAEPTKEPTAEPSEEPTKEPTAEPSEEPTKEPTAEPTAEPSEEPTKEPTAEPGEEPTKEPTKEPTAEPSEEPTKEPTKEPEKESGPLENLQVSAGNEEDVQTILEAYQWYEGCTEDEQSMVPQDLVIRLKKAQSACKVYNRTSNGITVSGEFPWYVQFRVTQGSQDANFDLGDLLGSYDMELWNLLEDEPYDLNGTPVTVTIPVSDADKYEKISVIHYLEDGSYEVLTPEVLDGAIRFTTTSFSPYSVAGEGRIAGSTVLVGPGDAIYNQSGSGSTSTGSNQQVSSVGASHSQSASGSGSSSVVRPQNSGGSSSSSSYDSDSRSTSDSERSNTRTASSVRTDDPNNLTPYLVVVVVAAALIIILIVAGTISARRKRRK